MDDVRRHGIPDPSERLRKVEADARGIAQVIGSRVPPGWGFALMFFEFGPSGQSTWISNAKRADAVKMLRELADRLERDEAGGPVAPFSQ